MSVYFIFSNIYHAKKDTPSIEHASSERQMAGRRRGEQGKEKSHFSSRKTASNVQEAFSVIFIID
jgi:hypothetical protein